MAKKRMPTLPKEVFSVLGPLPVTISKTLVDEKEAIGLFKMRKREVEIDKGSVGETRWQTFGHETMHIVLNDGGATDLLEEKVEEAVCNAFGTWLAAAVQAGYIKFTTPRERKTDVG